MPIQTIDRGTAGNPSDTFKIGVALDTAQANDEYLDAEVLLRAPIADPTFTGDPKAPTPSLGNDTTSIATTAFVQNEFDDRTFATVAALALASLPIGRQVMTKGCLSAGDGGGGTFIVEAASGSPDGYGRILLANGNHAVLQTTNGMYDFRQFGAVGGGDDTYMTDNATALDLVLTGYPRTVIPADHFIVEVVAGDNFIPAADACLTGINRYQSLITFKSAVTTYKIIFKTTNANFDVKKIGFAFDGQVNDSTQFFVPASTGLTISKCGFDGQNTALNANLVNFINFVDSNCADILVRQCEINNVQRVILRSNSTVGDIDNVEFSKCNIHDLGQGGVQFNMPNPAGVGTNIRILDNVFATFHAGTEKIFAGGSCVKQITIRGNIFNGAANECVHLEEGVENAIVSQNTFSIDGDGVVLSDNNVSGGYLQPTNIIISGNTFIDAGGANANIGIQAPNDGVGIKSFAGLVISGNTFTDYDRAINLDVNDYEITGNIITNCTTGIQATAIKPAINNNTFVDCDTGIKSTAQGGLAGINTFRLSSNSQVMAVSSFGEKVGMNGFRLTIESDTNLPASTTTSVLLKAKVGAEMWGHIKINVYVGTTSYQHRISEIYYDGATLTDTERMRSGSGSVTIPGFVNSAGELAISLNNTAGVAATLKQVAVEFTGLWVSVG